MTPETQTFRYWTRKAKFSMAGDMLLHAFFSAGMVSLCLPAETLAPKILLWSMAALYVVATACQLRIYRRTIDKRIEIDDATIRYYTRNPEPDLERKLTDIQGLTYTKVFGKRCDFKIWLTGKAAIEFTHSVENQRDLVKALSNKTGYSFIDVQNTEPLPAFITDARS